MSIFRAGYSKTNRLGVHLGPVKSEHNVDYKLVSPFVRSVIAMMVVFAIFAVFSSIGYSVLQDALASWERADKLSGLVSALFSTFWLVGWSIGIIVPFIILLTMMFGRQVVLIHSGRVDFIIGIPGIGFRISGPASEITAIELVEHDSKTTFPNKGKQIKISSKLDKDMTPFGSEMTLLDVSEITQAINANRETESGLDDGSKAMAKMAAKLQRKSEPKAETVDRIDQAGVAAVTITSGSTLLLIAANLVPIFGVLFFEWDLGATMILYWAETAIILVYSIVKNVVANGVAGAILSIFVTAHASAFMVMHFLFIWVIFVEPTSSDSALANPSSAIVFAYLAALWPALLALFISHGYSLKTNFLDTHDSQDDKEQQSEPFYSRIFMMHLTLIIGGGLSFILGQGYLALCLLILMKIVVDVRAHINHHTKKHHSKQH